MFAYSEGACVGKESREVWSGRLAENQQYLLVCMPMFRTTRSLVDLLLLVLTDSFTKYILSHIVSVDV